ncbi:MAG: AhpC/TSA family protein [Marinilabiliaceae bacterium]|nr:AhpC/TSA family protein [Marinilabiliaceae bacterium]
MRKIFIGVVAVLFFFACTSENTIEISGNIEGVDNATSVILYRMESNKPFPIDTVKMVDNKMKFEIDTIMPQLFLISFEGHREPLAVFGGKENITINGSVDNISEMVINGGLVTENFAAFNRNLPGKERMESIRNEYSRAQMTGDTVRLNDLEAELKLLSEEQFAFVKKVVEQNSDNDLGAWLCIGLVSQNKYTVEELESLISKFEASSMGNNMYVKNVKSFLGDMKILEDAEKATAIGNIAPDFTLKSVDGNEITLDSYKGRVVLIDFWASWCNPCRMENPNVVKMYNRFSANGFEILGVSVDRNEEQWKSAIEQDKLTWIQMRDLNGDVSKTYGIKSIPSTILLDKDGKIVAKNLRGEELSLKIEELLK